MNTYVVARFGSGRIAISGFYRTSIRGGCGGRPNFSDGSGAGSRGGSR